MQASDQDDSDSEESDASEADGGLVLVKKKQPLGDDEGEGQEGEGDSLLRKTKEKKMRITSDGVAAAGVARKSVFDDDGAAVVSDQ